ncbi:MAG: hypothetical protein AAGD35_02535 [Actinomycetota bacterium]
MTRARRPSAALLATSLLIAGCGGGAGATGAGSGEAATTGAAEDGAVAGPVADDELRTEAAAIRLDEVTVPNELPVGVFDELDECPADPFADLTAEAAAVLGAPYALAFDQGEQSNRALRFAETQPVQVSCRHDDDVNGMGFLAATAPDDLRAWIDDYLGLDPDDDTVTIIRSATHRGGTFHRMCLATPDGAVDFCEVYWVDDHLLVGFSLSGPDVGAADLDAVENLLVGALDDLVTNIETAVPAYDDFGY